MTTTCAPDLTLTQTIHHLSNPTPIDVSDTLVQLWAESTPQHAKDEYVLQWRILQALVNQDIPIRMVQDAMGHCEKISQLEQGNCLTEMYGTPNTYDMRQTHLKQESAALTYIAAQIGWKL